MRFGLILLMSVLAAPAAAWTFRADPVCTLDHQTDALRVTVTHDPRLEQSYAIALTLAEGVWPVGDLFAIRFDGARNLTITTDRHVLSDGGSTLTVTDTGFGNVLGGIGMNQRAVVMTGGAALVIPLQGAGGPLDQFLACPATPTS